MVEALQALIMADATTALFILAVAACLAALYLLHLLYVVAVPKQVGRQSPRKAEGGSDIQRGASRGLGAAIRWFASRNITPNQITIVGLLLVIFNCIHFLYHRDTFLFGSSLIVSYLFDMLDGKLSVDTLIERQPTREDQMRVARMLSLLEACDLARPT